MKLNQQEDFWSTLNRNLRRHCSKYEISTIETSGYASILVSMKELYKVMSHIEEREEYEVEVTFESLNRVNNDSLLYPLSVFLRNIYTFLDREDLRNNLLYSEIQETFSDLIVGFLKDTAYTYKNFVMGKYDKGMLKEINSSISDYSYRVVYVYRCLTSDGRLFTPILRNDESLQELLKDSEHTNSGDTERNNDLNSRSLYKREAYEAPNFEDTCKLYINGGFDSTFSHSNDGIGYSNNGLIHQTNGLEHSKESYVMYAIVFPPAILFIVFFLIYLAIYKKYKK